MDSLSSSKLLTYCYGKKDMFMFDILFVPSKLDRFCLSKEIRMVSIEELGVHRSTRLALNDGQRLFCL